jgi:predicted membrane protein
MKNKSYAQILTGLLVLALGVGFMFDALNIVDFSHSFSTWWPAIIIAVSVVALVSNPRMWMWPTATAAFGTLLLLRNFDVVNFNVWSLIWPTIIILVGLSILFRREGWDRPKDDSEDVVTATAIFSGQNLRSVSNKFKGGDVSAIFGGVDLDLRDAKIEGKATMNIFAAFGGVDIKVPEGWVIKVSGMPFFGGWEDKTKKPADAKNAPTLKINGTCIFGGVSIKNKND